jgi:hypothetical protein
MPFFSRKKLPDVSANPAWRAWLEIFEHDFFYVTSRVSAFIFEYSLKVMVLCGTSISAASD